MFKPRLKLKRAHVHKGEALAPPLWCASMVWSGYINGIELAFLNNKHISNEKVYLTCFEQRKDSGVTKKQSLKPQSMLLAQKTWDDGNIQCSTAQVG